MILEIHRSNSKSLNRAFENYNKHAIMVPKLERAREDLEASLVLEL